MRISRMRSVVVFSAYHSRAVSLHAMHRFPVFRKRKPAFLPGEPCRFVFLLFFSELPKQLVLNPGLKLKSVGLPAKIGDDCLQSCKYFFIRRELSSCDDKTCHTLLSLSGRGAKRKRQNPGEGSQSERNPCIPLIQNRYFRRGSGRALSYMSGSSRL